MLVRNAALVTLALAATANGFSTQSRTAFTRNVAVNLLSTKEYDDKLAADVDKQVRI